MAYILNTSLANTNIGRCVDKMMTVFMVSWVTQSYSLSWKRCLRYIEVKSHITPLTVSPANALSMRILFTFSFHICSHLMTHVMFIHQHACLANSHVFPTSKMNVWQTLIVLQFSPSKPFNRGDFNKTKEA